MSMRAMGNGMGSEKGAGVGIRLGIEQCESFFFTFDGAVFQKREFS